MLRTLRALLVLSVVSIPALAAAQEPEEATQAAASDEAKSDKPTPANPEPAPAPAATASVPPAAISTVPFAPLPATEAKPEGLLQGWKFEVNGYFRAPMALGISSRPNPDEMGRLDPTDPDGKRTLPDGPSHTQISYGPNRVLDWSYYSFAYTRLQEQDWAELTVHAKKKHVEAAMGWMGYWLSAAGFRNPDAAGIPGIATLALDTDFTFLGITPNIALKMGAWWPGYGYFEKYDTFTLGRFRYMGEQVRLTVPLNTALTVTLDQGFGTGRDGKFGYSDANTTPLYAGFTAANLIVYGNARLAYQKYLDVGLHYNYEWTRDPYLVKEAGADTGKSYSAASQAHLAVGGAEANVTLPYVGRLWISPSYINVKNGWALAGQGGTEVMHSLSGLGIAANYMQYNGDPPSSTGSGSMLNLGFLYENSLSNALGKAAGSIPDLRVSVFGLLVRASLDLPANSPITLKSINQLKYGADATLQAVDWLAFMLRWDTVNYDIDLPAFIFSAITARLTLSSHFLSGECIYLQYSRYIYGDQMVLAGKWPVEKGGSGWPLVAGTGVLQAGKYSGTKPDENVVKLQAQIVF